MPGACDACKAKGGISRYQCISKGHTPPAAAPDRRSTRHSRVPDQVDISTWGRASQAASRQARGSRQGSETAAGGDGRPLKKKQRMSVKDARARHDQFEHDRDTATAYLAGVRHGKELELSLIHI